MIYSDAHIHCSVYDSWQPFENSPVCSAAHSEKEWEKLCLLKKQYPGLIYTSFGVHPQNPDHSLVFTLEKILKTQHPDAVGEAGFDLFTAEYKENIKKQEDVWYAQLELAQQYNKPLIIHCRKALDKIFASSAQLRTLKAVVFHSYSYSPEEAASLRKKGINAYFSFGKPLLNNHKNALRCASLLPLEWILLETDGPYQTLKDELMTIPADIFSVYTQLSSLRSIRVEALNQVNINFMNVYSSSFE